MNASPAPTDPAWCSVGRSLRAAGIDPDGWTADPDMLGRLIERIDDQQRSIASSPQVAVHHIVAEPAGAGAALDPAHDDAFVWRPDEGPGSADVAGPLAGCRLAVKDNISVAGAPTGAGLAGVSFNSGDAEVVARLRALGATVVGTTTLPELAIGEHPVPTRNPRDRTRGCGGSSTGSAAAVASGRADLGLGTDTAGSVRLPAALCGVVGYKPSTGVLPIDGVVPLAWSLDTVGVLAPDVAAARAAMAALLDAGAAPHEPSGDWSGARVGVVPQLTVDLDAEVEPAYGEVVRAISRAGATLVDVPFGWLDQALAASSVVIATEAAAAHGHLVSAGLVSPDVARRLCAGALYTGVQYARACRAVRGVAAAYGSIAGEVDVIVTPTVPTVAPPFDGKVPGATRLGWIRSSVVWSVAGAPAVSVPVPSAGLPVGVQVSGRRGDDAAVLAWAASLERTVRR